MTAPVRMTKELYVGAMPTPYLLAELREWGIKSVINCRYDEEPHLNIDHATAQIEAARWGFEYRYCPVKDRLGVSDLEIDDYILAFNVLPKPIYSYCRLGFRSTAIWAMAQLEHQQIDDLVEIAFDAGYDLHPFRNQLERRLWVLRKRRHKAVPTGI